MQGCTDRQNDQQCRPKAVIPVHDSVMSMTKQNETFRWLRWQCWSRSSSMQRWVSAGKLNGEDRSVGSRLKSSSRQRPDTNNTASLSRGGCSINAWALSNDTLRTGSNSTVQSWDCCVRSFTLSRNRWSTPRTLESANNNSERRRFLRRSIRANYGWLKQRRSDSS